MNILNSKSRNILFLFIGLISLFFITVIGEVNATVSNNDNDENEDQTKDDIEMMNLKIKINLNNIDQSVQKIKIVSFVNGEAKEQYVDLVKDQSKIKNNIMTINMQFPQSNDISSIIATDQYFVCGYVIKDNTKNSTTISNNEISLYDCDEGNIGNPNSATAKLFFTLNKYNESVNYNKLNGQRNSVAAKEVKINVKVPLDDASGDHQISVIGMVRGEYKVEILNAKKALEKQSNNNDDEILDVPFIFNRVTEAGTIQLGDKFFGCVAGEEFSPQHTHCEKRIIKDYEKGNELYSRKDNRFK